jgi:DNA repair protein RadC
MTRPGTELFGKALLKEAIELLPGMPIGISLEEARLYVRQVLHYNAVETRIRFSNYVLQRMFPTGRVDDALLLFARVYAGRQELRDVCGYRFSKVEPLVPRVVDEVLMSVIGAGKVKRRTLREYLRNLYPAASDNTIQSCAQAVVDVLDDSRIASATKTEVSFSLRDVLPASLAFILHSEFPVPGMYDLDSLQRNPLVRCMLWSPERIEAALYELRNGGLISKVSQIDDVRQFTTSFTLDQVVTKLRETSG